MRKIITETLPTFFMVLLVTITLALTFSVGLVETIDTLFICLYLTIATLIVFSIVITIKYLKVVK